MKRMILLSAILLTMSLPASGGTAYQLVHRPTASTLNYLATYYAQTTDVLTVSQASGEEATYTNRSYEYIEAQKELTKTSAGPTAQTIESTVRTNYIKKVHHNQVAASISPETRTSSQSPLGRLVTAFSWEDLLHLGLPILMPREEVGPGDHWERSIDFKVAGYPTMLMNMNYELKRIGPWQSGQGAELVYTVRAVLDATKLTTDPELRRSLAELKQNNIESVSFEGRGEILFELERGLPITHTLAINQMVRKNTIKGTERLVQDFLTTHEFAEALIN